MSKNGFKSILLVTAVIAVVAIGIVLYLKNQPREFGQPIVVLAFLDRVDKPSSNILQNWQDANLAIEYVDNCTSKKNDKATTCITNVIQNIAKFTSAADVELVVLADYKYTNTLLAAYAQDHLTDEVAALAFMQSSLNLPDAKKINLPKTVVINTPQDASKDFIARRRAVEKLLADDNWIWPTTLSTENINSLIEHPVLPEMILYLLDKQEKVQYLAEFNAESRWQQPLFDNEDYFTVDKAINEYPVDHDLQRILTAFFHHEPYQLKQWPLNSYQGFDLLTYRSLLPAERTRSLCYVHQQKRASFLSRFGSIWSISA